MKSTEEVLICVESCMSADICDSGKHWCCYGDAGLTDCVDRLETDYQKILEAVKSIGTLDRLKEICEAEKDGRLVVLPCKVGTRVWVIGQNCDLCRDMYAEEPCLFGSCEYKEVFESVFGYGMIDNFGKTVFLTRAEAEAALKEE